MDREIFNILQRVAEAEEAEKAQLRQETSPDLGMHFRRHDDDLEELAFDLLNIAWSDAMQGDIVQQLIEVKQVGLGDIDYVEEDLRGLYAYWQGKGGQILSDVLRYERNMMPREEMVASLDYHQDEIALNFWGAFDKLTTQAREKLRQLPVKRLIELIAFSIQGGATYGTFAASSLTDAQFDPILEEVAIRSDRVTIVGTRPALSPLAAIGLEYGDDVARQVFDTGQIGVYKGYPVAQIQNFEGFDGHFVVPNNEIWIVGSNAGRLTFYGSTPKVQQLKRPSFWGRWETARDAGMLLYGAQKGRIGRVVLT